MGARHKSGGIPDYAKQSNAGLLAGRFIPELRALFTIEKNRPGGTLGDGIGLFKAGTDEEVFCISFKPFLLLSQNAYPPTGQSAPAPQYDRFPIQTKSRA